MSYFAKEVCFINHIRKILKSFFLNIFKLINLKVTFIKGKILF